MLILRFKKKHIVMNLTGSCHGKSVLHIVETIQHICGH